MGIFRPVVIFFSIFNHFYIVSNNWVFFYTFQLGNLTFDHCSFKNIILNSNLIQSYGSNLCLYSTIFFNITSNGQYLITIAIGGFEANNFMNIDCFDGILSLSSAFISINNSFFILTFQRNFSDCAAITTTSVSDYFVLINNTFLNFRNANNGSVTFH